MFISKLASKAYLSSLLALPLITLAAAQGFRTSCHIGFDVANPYLEANGGLYACCPANNGQKWLTRLDLNRCVSNGPGGKLIFANGGGYSKTCTGCGIVNEESLLYCTCRGNLKVTALDLVGSLAYEASMTAAS